MRDQALDLLKRLCTPSIQRHCLAVEKLAVEMAGELPPNYHVDIELLSTGAILHDIGRAYTHTIAHGVVGACIVGKFGFPDAVCHIVERHIGGGITREEAERMNLPPADYTPETIEEMLVAHADNLIDGDRRISLEDAVNDLRRKNRPSIVEKRVLELAKKVDMLMNGR
ncbi:MAG: HD domain-containing protein [Methermicoccaceae archaeon]